MRKNIIMAAVLLFSAVGVIFNFYRYSKIAPEIDSGSSQSEFGQNLTDFRRLKNSKLDVSLFQNSTFKSLELSKETSVFSTSTSTPGSITPGRINPFAPF